MFTYLNVSLPAEGLNDAAEALEGRVTALMLESQALRMDWVKNGPEADKEAVLAQSSALLDRALALRVTANTLRALVAGEV